MRGSDAEGEIEVPETVLPEVIRSPTPRVRNAPVPAPLAWGGDGNVLAAAGVTLFALVAGKG